jgi:hypothetical protein
VSRVEKLVGHLQPEKFINTNCLQNTSCIAYHKLRPNIPVCLILASDNLKVVKKSLPG